MAQACRALDFPVVAGNVSLYNETNGVAIPPTPAIGGVGLLTDASLMADVALKCDGNLLVLIGREEGHLGQSLYQDIIGGKREGAPPMVDLEAEKSTGAFVRALIRGQRVQAVHDVSDGGLLVAIAEMALAGNRGAELYEVNGYLPDHAIWFGEDQARYVIEVEADQAEIVLGDATSQGLTGRIVGRIGGEMLAIGESASISLAALRAAHESWLPRFMQTGHS
jgi:phosphoribosylformylglycinamidine (FGAM) synthase-like enzyme